MKDLFLRSEPTRSEVDRQTEKTLDAFHQLFMKLRKLCELNGSQTAQLLEIDRSNLWRLENKLGGITHGHYCQYVCHLLIYMHSNQLALPEELRVICNYFVPEIEKR